MAGLETVSYTHLMRALYRCLISAMLAGRIVWGIVQCIQFGMIDTPFTWQLFFAGAFGDAVLGILLQLFLIPFIMTALHKSGFFQLQPDMSK